MGVFGWLWTKNRRVTIGVALAALLVIAFFLWLFLYFYLGDDLIMNMETNQTSFNITNVQNGSVHVDVQTQGQLFCSTECRLALLDANSHSVNAEAFTLKAGQSHARDFALMPGRIGTGQSLYSVVATCVNVESALCPTLAPERRKTILLTVNYHLSTQESEVKPALKAQLERLLGELRESDLIIKEISGITTANPRLHAGEVVTNLTRIQEEFGQHNLFLESAKRMWAEQSYLPLDALLAQSNTTDESLRRLTADANAIRDDVLALPALHESLRLRLENARAAVQALLASYGQLNETASQQAMIAASASSDAAVTVYSTDSFSSYENLSSIVGDVERNISALNATLIMRYTQAVRLGNELATAEAQASCVARNGTNCTGIAINLTTLPQLCGIADMNVTNGTNATNASINVTNMSIIANATYRSMYCGNGTAMQLNMTPLTPLVLQVPNVTSTIETELTESAPQCCVFGDCRPCCNGDSCSDDPQTYPVIFVHGHAFNGFNSPEYSLGGYFTKIQQRLQQDGYIDAGILTPSSTLAEVQPGEWGVSGRPVTVRVSYYYNFYKSGTQYVTITQKSENIETYAIRLNELVKTVQHHTGKKKVKIVAHSMGGLVVRRYMQLFGEDAVDEVILIGTPDHGVVARTAALCPVLGESKECDDMQEDSVFMHKINDPESQPHVKVVTIAGSGCDTGGQDGDGVVRTTSVPLEYATNYVVNGTCTDFFGSNLHTELLNIDTYPQVYDIVRKELK